MKGTLKRVKGILEENPYARNCDNSLLIQFYDEKFKELGVKYDISHFRDFLALVEVWKLPPLWSVTRTRRRIQALHPELRANDEVQIMRELKEDEMRKWAREAI